MKTKKDPDYEEWNKIFDSNFKWMKNREDRSVIDYSEEILGRMELHESSQGALFVEITGAPGAGKTGTLLSCVERSLWKFPNEKVFINECFDVPIQATKLGKGKYHLMVEEIDTETDEICFFDRNTGKQAFPEITKFSAFEECYEKAKIGVANVVFFKDRMKMIEFIGYLRTVCKWTHVFIDEISECAPAFASGDSWRRIEKFSFILKDIRKTCINVYCTTQSVSDTDSRVRKKIQTKIYLPGSIHDKNSRITQRALDNLKEDHVNGNEGYIEYFGRFCKTRFNKIYKPDQNNLIDARVMEKKVNDEEKVMEEEDARNA